MNQTERENRNIIRTIATYARSDNKKEDKILIRSNVRYTLTRVFINVLNLLHSF